MNRARLHLSTFTQRTCVASHTRTGQTHDSAPTALRSAVAPSQRPIRCFESGGREGGRMEMVFLLERGGDRDPGGGAGVCVRVCV